MRTEMRTRRSVVRHPGRSGVLGRGLQVAAGCCCVLLFAGVLAACAVDRDLSKAPSHLEADGGLDHDAWIDLARRMEERGDLTAALRFYRQAAVRDPRDAAAWQETMRLAFLLGEDALARAAFEKARALAPGSPGVLVAEARFLILDDRPLDARRVLSRVPAAARGAAYYRVLGLSFDLEGAHARARQVYAQGLERAPEDAGLMVDLALSLALDENYGAANDILRRLADRPGMEGLARANLALVAALAGDAMLAAGLAGEPAGEVNLGFYRRLASLKGGDRARALILGRLPAGREKRASRASSPPPGDGTEPHAGPTPSPETRNRKGGGDG